MKIVLLDFDCEEIYRLLLKHDVFPLITANPMAGKQAG